MVKVQTNLEITVRMKRLIEGVARDSISFEDLIMHDKRSFSRVCLLD